MSRCITMSGHVDLTLGYSFSSLPLFCSLGEFFLPFISPTPYTFVPQWFQNKLILMSPTRLWRGCGQFLYWDHSYSTCRLLKPCSNHFFSLVFTLFYLLSSMYFTTTIMKFFPCRTRGLNQPERSTSSIWRLDAVYACQPGSSCIATTF